MSELLEKNAEISVLIVDDEAISRDQLARWLKRSGEFQVSVAGSGEEAIERVHGVRGDYDAIVMDQELPGMSGIEAMKQLRADYPSLPILMFTGRDPKAGVEALKQGAYRYFLKPFQPDELAMTIRAMAEARKQQVHARETGWLQAMLRLSQGATILSRDKLLQEVASAARDLLSGAVAIIWEADRSAGVLRVAACSGDVDQEYFHNIPIDLNAPATQRFLGQHRPLYLSDVTDPIKAPFYNDYHRQMARRRGLVSLLSAPMIAENRLIGILDIYTESMRRFPNEDHDLLQMFASQTAIALENAELLGRAASQRSTLERLVDIGGTLIREVPGGLKPVLDKAAQIACEFTGADSTTIYPYDPTKELFYDPKSVAVYGGEDADWFPKDKPRKRGLAAVIRELGEVVIYDVDNERVRPTDLERIEESSYDRDTVLYLIKNARYVLREGVKAFIGLSLKAGRSNSGGEDEVGVMYINFRQPHAFTDEEIALIRIFTNQVGCSTKRTIDPASAGSTASSRCLAKGIKRRQHYDQVIGHCDHNP